MTCSLNLTENVGLSLLPNLRHTIQAEAVTTLEEITLKAVKDRGLMMNVVLCRFILI